MDNKNFFVQLPSKTVDPRGYYKQGLVDNIKKYPWLKVAGMDAPFTTKNGKEIRGIDFAGADHLITFGTAKSHDINWVENGDYARKKGYAPVFDLQKDYALVLSKLDAFANARKPRPTYNTAYLRGTSDVFYVSGQRVEVYDNYIKIGMNIIPRNTPIERTISYYTPAQIETLRTVIVTVRNW